MKTTLLRIAFWCSLLAFLAWDWSRSPPVNIRLEPPLFAAGSGQSSDAGHCSAPR